MIVETFTKLKAQDNEAALSPEVIRKIYSELSSEVDAIVDQGEIPVVACSPMARPYFRKLIEAVLSNVTVLSFAEIPPEVEIKSIATIGL